MVGEAAAGVPALDFHEWQVPFPSVGGHVFLPRDDLRRPRAADAPLTEVGVWLARTESGMSIILPSGMQIIRGGMRVISMAVLHHGDKLDLGGHFVRFKEIRRITLEAGSRLLKTRCPQCHATHREGTEVIRCPFCGEAYCEDCWASLRYERCCARNCRFSPGPVEAADGDG